MNILFKANASIHNKPASKRFLRLKVSSTSLKVFFTSFWSSAVVLYILNTRSTRSGVVLWKYNSSNFFFTNLMNTISLMTTIKSLEPQKKKIIKTSIASKKEGQRLAGSRHCEQTFCKMHTYIWQIYKCWLALIHQDHKEVDFQIKLSAKHKTSTLLAYSVH